MPRFHLPAAHDPRDEVIANLRNDLDIARQTIVSIVPAPFNGMLKSFYSAKTRQEGELRLFALEAEIADLSKPILEAPDRAYCPLCGEGSNSPCAIGFSLPEGVRRHLSGWGNTMRCRVMAAASSLARSHFERTFKEAEAQEARSREASLAARMASETLYLVDPHEPVELWDSKSWWGKPRKQGDESVGGFEWAEARLRGMAFQVNLQGRTKSYTKRHVNAAGAYLVYADPRQEGNISFLAFKETPGLKPSKARLCAFEIRDGWKNGLSEKLTARIDERSARG